MYLAHYKFREFPFAVGCEERFFYESPTHAEALANMQYTVQQGKGMVLVSGEVGSGKTFLSNMLAARLGPGCKCLVVSNPPQSGKQLLRAVLSRLGVSSPPEADKLWMSDELESQLERLQGRSRLVTLILDEAQALSDEALDEVRMLWNFESSGRRLIQIVLVGQPELRDRIQEVRWEPLRQRIVLSYHLGQLSEQDLSDYIDHRLRTAADEGCQAAFTPEAKKAIYQATGGIPRMTNILCDNALLVGYSNGVHVIDADIIHEVLRDMTCWGLRTPDDSGPLPGGGQNSMRI
jgi:general secretion pathway protein A